MSEIVIMFAGPMGAGKTSAIQSLSEIPVVNTEVANSERGVSDKATTTVALDYGEITIGEDEKVRLYGVPGQKRFSFMWRIIKERAIGMVLLINNNHADPIASMIEFLDEFDEFVQQRSIVIVLSHTDIAPDPSIEVYREALQSARPGTRIPVVCADTRNSTTMREALMTVVETIALSASELGADGEAA